MTDPALRALVAEGHRLLDASAFDAARRTAIDALMLDSSSPAALNLRGMVEAAEQNNAEAARFFERAVEAEPAEAAHRINHALSLVSSGAFDEARRELGMALSLEPDNAVALQNLVWITRIRPGDAIIERLSAFKRRLETGSSAYVKISYALGKCFDDVGDYDEAFAHFRDANETQPSLYETARHEAYFRAVKAVWTPDFFRSVSGDGHPSRRPVFIVGLPRCGSTLIEDRLCASGDIAGLGEIPDIIALSNAVSRAHPRGAAYPFWCGDVPPDGYGGLGRLYVENCSRKAGGAERFINKSLLNYAYVGMMATMLPQGLVIESRRNPVDTCLSCYFTDLKPIHHYAIRLDTLGHAYRLYADLMAWWRGFVGNLITVEHEAFVADPDGGVAALRERMGLARAGSNRGAAARHVQTFSAWQVRQPVTAARTGRWKNYEKHLGPLLDALGDLAR